MSQAVEAQGITVRYGETLALDEASITVAEGELVGLTGPNGAGKSTLLRVIAGLTPICSGRVIVLGREVSRLGYNGIRASVGYVPQRVPKGRFPVSVFEIVLSGRYGQLGLFRNPGRADRDAAREAIARLGVEGLEDRRVDSLSGGQQQRVFLARALAQQPRLLLLDEPTSSLDIDGQRQLMELVARLNREDGLTTILVSHSEALAAICPRIYRVVSGRAQEAPGTIIAYA